MPQSSSDLQKMFMADGSDGIHKAEITIEKAGGTVEKGVITYDGENGEALDAVQFLIQEWDYSMKED